MRIRGFTALEDPTTVTLMTRAEYERRIADYSVRLGRRERSALVLTVPALVLGAAAIVVLSRFATKSVVLIVAFSWLGLLAASALWILFWAWRLDRREGVVVPCGACGIELATEHDLVVVAGQCPRCGAPVIADAH